MVNVIKDIENTIDSVSIKADVGSCIFIISIILILYGQVWNHQFISFDDFGYVVSNKHVQSGLGIESIKWAFSFNNSHGTYWHPLTWISHMIDVMLYGDNAGSHVMTNVFFHIANSLLIYFLFKKMGVGYAMTMFIASIFAVHPMNVESVAWIAERKNVLSTFFLIIILIAYVHYAMKPSLLRYLLITCMLVLGLMAKPMLVTVPFIFLLLDFFPLDRFKIFNLNELKKPDKKKVGVCVSYNAWLVIEKLPFLLLVTGTSLLITRSLKNSYNIISFTEVPLSLRLENIVVSYCIYLKKYFFPTKLVCFYPYPKVSLYYLLRAVLFYLFS